ncbi:hypothetical protein RIF29_15546 [Crotalaria pallida]|uniref:Polygalacturonase n=1 Tax=Crotalaria pallida TaxID=3830 RepID=A0AAN9FHE2_CROPI
MAARWILLVCLLVCIVEAQGLSPLILARISRPRLSVRLFNVESYGAIADGKTDNSAAFLKAWDEACNWGGLSSIVVPHGTYMLKQVVFSGPCKGWTTFEIRGVLKAPTDPPTSSERTWINFRYVNQLNVNGGGTLDGQGALVWGHKPVYMTMGFAFVTNSYVHNLRSSNSQNAHFALFACENMTFTNIMLTAPRDSPNTDGIKIGRSKGITIKDAYIATGDDCIAIISGTKKVTISNVFCGPGHGISVGSLGKHDNEVDVKDISVKNCTFYGTYNGLRIKTWASPLNHTLKASNFVYEDIFFKDVEHPIIIDQEYCPGHHCGNMVPSSVQISNVSYKNIQGSCKNDVAVSFKCSEKLPCQNITMEDINLWSSSKGSKRRLTNYCSHANGASYGKQIPLSCI